MKYNVFISYRHVPLDMAAAEYLHKTLEHYRIPKEIRKKTGIQRINRVFRDENELEISSDLFRAIEENLKESEFLVIIASPHYLESEWCQKELDTFLKYRDIDHVLVVLTEGEPGQVFPPALMKGKEPLAMDVRGDSVWQVKKNIRERLPRLLAPILHCDYDELVQRKRVYRLRRLAAAMTVVTGVSLGFGGITFYQNRQISENYRSKQENQSRYLANTAEELLKQGDRESALLVALEALPESSSDTSRPYVTEARTALEDALYTYKMGLSTYLNPFCKMEHKSRVTDKIDFLESQERLLTVDEDDRITIWSLDGEMIFESEKNAYWDGRLADAHRFFGLGEDGITCVDYQTGETLWHWSYPDNAGFSDSARKPGTSCVSVWDYNFKDDYLIWAEPVGSGNPGIYSIDGNDGNSECLVNYKGIFSKEEDGSVKQPVEVFQLSFSPDYSRLAVDFRQPTVEEEPEPYQINIYDLKKKKDDSLTLQYCAQYEYFCGASVSRAYWLDEERLLLGYDMQSTNKFITRIGKDSVIRLECFDVTKDKILYSMEEPVNYWESKIGFYPLENKKDVVLSVICGNTMINLNPDTGERYYRMEDQSQIIATYPFDAGGMQVILTQDGRTTPTDTRAHTTYPYGLYQSRMELGEIQSAICYRRNDLPEMLVCFDNSIVRYQVARDQYDYQVEDGLFDSEYSPDEKYIALAGDEKISLYDAEQKKVVFEDDYSASYVKGNHRFTDVDHLQYLINEGCSLVQKNMISGERTEYEIPDVNKREYSSSLSSLTFADGTNKDVTVLWSVDTFTEEDAYGMVWMFDNRSKFYVNTFYYKDLEAALEESYGLNMKEWYVSISVNSASLSTTGRYLIITCSVICSEKEELSVLVYDTEKKEFVSIPQEIREMFDDNQEGVLLQKDGWLSTTEDVIAVYGKGAIQIVDLSSMQILYSIEESGIGSKEISFTPDGEHLIYQDSSWKLKVYNWRKGVYTWESVVPETGSMDYDFYQNGSVMSAETNIDSDIAVVPVRKIYLKKADGQYKLDNTIENCVCSNGKTAIISTGNNKYIFTIATLDELIAEAKEILQGRELTEAQRKTYLVD